MSRFFNRKSIVSVLIALALIAAFVGGIVQRGAATKTHAASSSSICQLAKNSKNPLSQGALEYCNPPNTNSSHPEHGSRLFGSNVDAANSAEDITPSGVHVNGQSETSIASVGSYVVEGWNDATGFFAPCPSPNFKEELTGYGFSANGGKSFTDEGGLPNANCTNTKYFGDPSVEAWKSGGTAYFYVSSLFGDANGLEIALAACSATGTGSTAAISCSQPILIAQSGAEDKEFLSIDPVRGKLYVSYTNFAAGSGNGQIELAACDIGTPSGGTGTGGGTAGNPVCFPGASATPYFIVAPVGTCVNQGSYPSVDVSTGDVYVAWEFNVDSNAFPPCNTSATPTQNKVAYVPSTCLTLTPVSPCAGPTATNGANVISLDNTPIPGYNRPGGQDFPRIAVSNPAGTVSIVWNDARFHPLGDILMQSFSLVSLTSVTAQPVQLNNHVGGLHFLPALRNTDGDGDLQITWYERATGSTTLTNVVGVIDVNPLTTKTPSSSVTVTTTPTDWNGVSSVIVPNFGDYTDNYVQAQSTAPYTTQTDFVAWSDGRTGAPQPFEAHAHTN